MNISLPLKANLSYKIFRVPATGCSQRLGIYFSCVMRILKLLHMHVLTIIYKV